MSSLENSEETRWPLRIAWFLTIVVIGSACLYVWFKGGISVLYKLNPNELGDALAGIGTTLAFIWLVAGSILQRDELRLQRQELENQREELKLQRKELAANAESTADLASSTRLTEQHARRDTVLRSLEITLPELNELTHMIRIQVWGGGPGYQKLKDQFDTGDKSVFCRLIARYLENENSLKGFREVLEGGHKNTDDLRENVRAFVSVYCEIEKMADEVGVGWITDKALSRYSSLNAIFQKELKNLSH